MSADGRLDAERNKYNVAGVQVANPQNTGDLSVGSDSRDPTNQVISQNLSLPSDVNGNIDGYVLTSDTSNTTIGMAWKPPVGLPTGTADKMAGFAPSTGVLEAKSNITHTVKGIELGQADVDQAGLSVKSNDTGLGQDELQVYTQSDATHAAFGIDITPRSSNVPARLLVNGNISLEAQSSNGLTGKPFSNITVKAINPITSVQYTSGYALAHFANNMSQSANDDYARVISLPSNTTSQLTALPAKLKTEYTNLATQLSSAGVGTLDPVHGDSGVSQLVDNALAYDHEQDGYFAYSQVSDSFVKLPTQNDIDTDIASAISTLSGTVSTDIASAVNGLASEAFVNNTVSPLATQASVATKADSSQVATDIASAVSALGDVTSVKETPAQSLTLSGGQAQDLTISNMFNFGSVMKVTAVTSSSQSADVNIRLEFYRTSNFANEDYTGGVEVICKPSQTTRAWANVTVEDDAGASKMYVKIQNTTSNTTLSATIQIKGAGV